MNLACAYCQKYRSKYCTCKISRFHVRKFCLLFYQNKAIMYLRVCISQFHMLRNDKVKGAPDGFSTFGGYIARSFPFVFN